MNLFDNTATPTHIDAIPSLSFRDDLYSDPLRDSWFQLAAWTENGKYDNRVENVVMRKSLLIDPGVFTRVADKLDAIGNLLSDLGTPGGSTYYDGESRRYEYHPTHRQKFYSADFDGEPIAFTRKSASDIGIFINPDLWMFLELEELSAGSGVWMNRARGEEVLRLRTIENGNLRIAEIRTAALFQYLKARQQTLLVGHYRHLHLNFPTQSEIDAFTKEDVTLSSSNAKAVLNNWGLREGYQGQKFLQRRLHLWFCIDAPPIDVDDPFGEDPDFDVFNFTIPTREGAVAPARFRHFKLPPGRTFAGVTCDSTSHIYFRQEVLMKYENASGFSIEDDGSVRCHDYWGLDRSTHRVGNDLISTMLCDFAEGVSVHEWPHWAQFAVEPPSLAMREAMAEEKEVPEAVNEVVDALDWLNDCARGLARVLSTEVGEEPWRGSVSSLAGRQLKWVYPSSSHDDEFLKRATLLSTLVIDGLLPSSLRDLLNGVSETLHLKNGKPLGSRNLLQRIALLAAIIETVNPTDETIEELIRCAEGESQAAAPDLQAELAALNAEIRNEFAPLAFLYDLRVAGGLAHPADPKKASAAASSLGLPAKDWRRADYLNLLALVAGSIATLNARLQRAIDRRDP